MKLIISNAILLLVILMVPRNIAADEKQSDHQLTAKVRQSMPKTSIKCGECPSGNPCSQQQVTPTLPPPSPPKIITQYCHPPPPPPPRFYYFSGPPDQDQTQPQTQPQGASATAPPPPRFTYVTAGNPPGNIYPTDAFNLEIYNGAISSYSCDAILGLLLLLLCGFLQMNVGLL